MKGATFLVAVVSKGFFDTLVRQAPGRTMRTGEEMTLREVSNLVGAGASPVYHEDDRLVRDYLQDLAHSARFRVRPSPVQEISLSGAVLVFPTVRTPDHPSPERDYYVTYYAAQQ